MLDFYKINKVKKGRGDASYYEVTPVFLIKKSNDMMARGGVFYAVWNKEKELWSTDIYDVQDLIDKELYAYAEKLKEDTGLPVHVNSIQSENSGLWNRFILMLRKLPDNFKQLDTEVAFANTTVTRNKYISKKLPYSITKGETPNFDRLFGTLYDEENLHKIMWALGSVIQGDSKNIQKFYVLYGAPGTGKSTVLNLISRMFQFHVKIFESEALGDPSNAFALTPFSSNPLIAIDHEGDLSNVRKNSVLSSVVSHDAMPINVKYQQPFSIRLNTTMFIATNKPVMITDRNSGLIRRLIDIRPTGNILKHSEYNDIYTSLEFELGAIAYKCLNVYKKAGPNYYDSYTPQDMMRRTNVVYNFIVDYSGDFMLEDPITLSKIWELYLAYCESSRIKNPLEKHKFRDELRNYWVKFEDRGYINGRRVRSVFEGFKKDAFAMNYNTSYEHTNDWLTLKAGPSVFDEDHKDQPAQEANQNDGTPLYKWDGVTTKLFDIDTSKLHYVLPKRNHIVIDFDLKNENGEKSLKRNLEAARRFPPTYAETSKSGYGLHLHYIYEGDVNELARIYDEDIEIKVPVGKSSIRRMLTLCNEQPITTINSGLPLRERKGDNVNRKTIANERALRNLIMRGLAKDIHPATKPSIDFISHILNEAYNQGLEYDVRDMESDVLRFAQNSTNNAEYCIQTVNGMKFKSDHINLEQDVEDERLVFFDVEVYPNLFLICWKYENSETISRMFNPKPSEVAGLLDYRLVGFNNRRYDNHILYGALLGYSLEELYQLSKAIINGSEDAYFDKAWGLSYADVYWFLSLRKSLKHLEVELGLPYDELDIPWDQPVDESLWERVAQYCENDLRATEAVFHAHKADFDARKILASLSGLRVNDSTRTHVARILFGDNKYPQSEFVYTDLSEMFPGYVYGFADMHDEIRGLFPNDNIPKVPMSIYKGELVGEGGYVWAKPGMYNNVVYLDIASMHPTSLIELNLFGEYTDKFAQLKKARILIKQKRLDEAKKLFGGRLAPFLEDEAGLDGLSYALKIALNSVYGYTSSRFDNPFRDPRNKDNIVAKRGALFMVDLKHALLERGCNPIHFKTDSVKIADFSEDDIIFVKEFGRKYGYDFEVEGVFDRMVLINDAVLIGKWKDTGRWEAVGARFAHPYVYKTLFSREPITFEDMVETRSVKKGTIYLELDNGTMMFIGRIGQFCPLTQHGGTPYRVQDDKKYALTATIGYKWYPAKMVKELGWSEFIDRAYFERLVEEAKEKVSEFGDLTIFLGEQ